MKQANDFASLCQNFGYKANLIELSFGKFPLQLMLAAKAEHDNDGDVMGWGIDVATACGKHGFKPVRVKLETALMPGVATYFEAHWKFRIKTEESRQKWVEFLKHTPGFLASKNLFDRGKFYLSKRVYNDPPEFPTDQTRGEFSFAKNVFSDAERHTIINAFGHKHVSEFEGGHYERVLYDSNPGLDAGWTVS